MSKKRKRISKYERTAENDIQYRGPITYRHMQIMGWICICFKVVDIVFSVGRNLDPNQPQWMLNLGNVAGFLGSFALPLFLLANFAIILDKKLTYKQQLIKFGGLSLGVVLLFVILKEHYVVGIVTAVIGDRASANQLVHDYIYQSAMTGSLIFNLFIDLFMCTLFMFFLEYEPVKYFQGKKRKWFRLMMLIPIAYEAGALILRITLVATDLNPPYIIYPFLTTKPFMSFVLFVILALHIKFDEYRFKKRDKKPEDFEAYIHTNDHSLRFSIFTSIMILITGMIDLVVYLGSIIFLSATAAGVDFNAAELSAEASAAMDQALPLAEKVVSAWRFGEHWPMILLIPLILLFSYTRNHKNPKADIYVPIGGAVFAVLVGIESTYQLIVANLPILMGQLMELAKQFFG